MTAYGMHLLESIRLEDGVFPHLPYHEQRMHRAQQELFGEITISSLARHLSVPEHAQQGLYKCRVVYGRIIEKIEFVPYHPRTIRTLRRVHCDTIDYSHKYEDRQRLNELFAQRDGCDDVLIIRKGLVTDTSYANILFYDGKRWVTPDQPLLRGTQRQHLLDRGRIVERMVRESEVYSFEQFRLINALLEDNYSAKSIINVI